MLIIAPFYATLAVWASTWFNHFDFLRIWKELALLVMLIIAAGYLVKQRSFLPQLLKDKLFLAILALAGLIGLMSLYAASNGVSREAIIFGDLIYFRMIGWFALTFTIHKTMRQEHWLSIRKMIILPAMAVVAFGLLQMFVLPADFLKHFGYGPSTIAAYQTVDNRPDFVRVQSTLRGPNPLGAYLLIIIILALARYFHNRLKRYLWLVAGSLVVLYGTYSRSAWAGLAFALAAWISFDTLRKWKPEARSTKHETRSKNSKLLSTAYRLLPTNKRFSHILALGVLALFVMGGGVVLVRQRNYLVQNVLLHTSNQSTSVISSNEQRNQAIRAGLSDVWHHPLGSGVGTAGPASLRNRHGPIKISENFFIQVGQEIGLIGLILFVTTLAVIGVRLYRREDLFSLALLVILIGLTFINLVSHAWADDTLAYVWWGLAGIALGSARIRKSIRT